MKLLLSTLFFLCFAFTAQLSDQVKLSVQGTLQKSTGAAVDNGDYSLTFKLYDAATNGNLVWSETQDNIEIVNGVYSVLLGAVEPLTAPFDETYYVGVAIDGGAELIPRTLLTSSPYALSLLGVDNLFPSSGPIGAGTVTPTAGYELHVKDDAGDGKLLVEGTTAALIEIKKGSTTGLVGFGSANNEFILNPGSNNTTLQYNGATKLTVKTDVVDAPNLVASTKLAVGTSTLGSETLYVNGTGKVTGNMEANSLRLSGGQNEGVGFYAFVSAPNSNHFSTFTPPAGTTHNYSLITGDGIKIGGEIHVTSDRRIKKDFHLSDKTADLSTLQKLRVTDYRHIDEIARGSAMIKGFIAQEVEVVFPEAVTTSPDFIPDVYALSASTRLSEGQMTISLTKNHGFAVGEEVKLILEKGEKKVIVTAVPAENSFVVAWDEAATEKVFVYGKKVNDFRTVDYDRIHTLNVSATQELASQVEQLKLDLSAAKEEIAALRLQKEQIQHQNDGLRSDLNGIESRLLKLENGAPKEQAAGTAQK